MSLFVNLKFSLNRTAVVAGRVLSVKIRQFPICYQHHKIITKFVARYDHSNHIVVVIYADSSS